MPRNNSGHHFSRSSSDVSVSSEIRNSTGSDCVSEVDLESGVLEGKLHLRDSTSARNCRICYMGLKNGMGIELGCSCKGDLGVAHRKCTETWFKFKGNTMCEICGAVALNIAGEESTETHSTTASAAISSVPAAPMILVEPTTFWQSRRIMNFLLASMVFAFVVSWFFHFKILS